MTVRPARLNAAIAALFVLGSACFVLGSVPAFVNAVGGPVDGVTYVVGSVLFTVASYAQLVQAQTPGATSVDERSQHVPVHAALWRWRPHDLTWLAAATQFPGTLFFNVSTVAALTHNATAADVDRYVWRPDLFGSLLFLVSSALAVRAVSGGRLRRIRWSRLPWRIAWVNMLGSVLFMASAVSSYVLPDSNELVNARIAVAGTLLGAVCFLVGAALMFPAWRQAIGPKPPTHSHRYP